jgi:hypothetical protein
VKLKSDDRKRSLGVRVDAAVRKKIDEVVEHFPQFGRSVLIRQALLVGMEEILSHPEKLAEPARRRVARRV